MTSILLANCDEKDLVKLYDETLAKLTSQYNSNTINEIDDLANQILPTQSQVPVDLEQRNHNLLNLQNNSRTPISGKKRKISQSSLQENKRLRNDSISEDHTPTISERDLEILVPIIEKIDISIENKNNIKLLILITIYIGFGHSLEITIENFFGNLCEKNKIDKSKVADKYKEIIERLHNNSKLEPFITEVGIALKRLYPDYFRNWNNFLVLSLLPV